MRDEPQSATDGEKKDIATPHELATFWANLPFTATDSLSAAGAARLARAYLDLETRLSETVRSTDDAVIASDLASVTAHDLDDSPAWVLGVIRRAVSHLQSPRSATAKFSLSGFAPRLYGAAGQLGSLGPFGLTCHVDPTLPDDVLEFRESSEGRVLAKIINVGKS